MTTGPRPTPTEILKLRGTFRPDRHADSVKPEKKRPVCPKWLNDDAKAIWRQMVTMLERIGVLSSVDGQTLTRYCTTWVRWRKAQEFLETHNEAYPILDENKKLKYMAQWPQVAIEHKLSLVLLRIEQEFGLTPASRSRIALPNEEQNKENPNERYFRRAE